MSLDPTAPPPVPLLASLPDADRTSLGEALRELLTHGSILGLEPGSAEIYAWCRQNLAWLREVADLAGLQIFLEHESRLVQAIPRVASLRLQLRGDATVVLLALWYEQDQQLREQGRDEALLTVEQLNQLLREKLLPDLKETPRAGRMGEILRLAARHHLVRFSAAVPFEQSRIEILATLRRVIPFQDIADWTRTAALHRQPGTEPEEADAEGASTP